MKKIKFRAWDKEIDNMFYNAQDTYDYGIFVGNEECPEESFKSVIQNDNYVLMQYIGLNDRQGQQIYEGDVVEIVDGPTLHPDNCYIGTKFKVFYNQESCSFMMQDIYDEDNTQYFDLDLDGIPPKYLEVIGNIYENKKLLEVE